MDLKLNFAKFLFYIAVAAIYAKIYYQYRDQFNGLSDDSSFLDCFYFSFTTFSTVGYGDISPKTDLTKLIVLSQQIILLLDFSNEVAKIMLPYLSN